MRQTNQKQSLTAIKERRGRSGKGRAGAGNEKSCRNWYGRKEDKLCIDILEMVYYWLFYKSSNKFLGSHSITIERGMNYVEDNEGDEQR